MDSSSFEDSRKKRDNREVVEGHASPPDEKAKKLRARKSKDSQAAESLEIAKVVRTKTETEAYLECNELLEGDLPAKLSVTSELACNAFDYNWNRSLDIESALHRVAQISDGVKEYVSSDDWISFRVGHAGDASMLAVCIRRTANSTWDKEQSFPETKKKPGSNSIEDTSLEVRLAEGLGDEDTPPSIFALLVEVISKDEEPKLVAAALFSTVRDERCRILLVEWSYVDDDIGEKADVIERRLWLRLCTLSAMTACNKIIEKKSNKGN